MVPKVEGPWDIHYVDRLLAQLEARAGLEHPILVHAILETAQGVANVEEIATASPRMQGMSFGPADLAASRRMKTTRVGGGHPGYRVISDPSENGAARASAQQDLWHYSIGRMVDACAGAGILPYYGPFGDIKDVEGCEAQFRAAFLMGCVGAWSLHPVQIDIAKKVFSPDPDEVAFARKVIEAIPDGRGVHMIDGKMQDDATWKQCRVMVDLAEMLAAKDPELAGSIRHVARAGHHPRRHDRPPGPRPPRAALRAGGARDVRQAPHEREAARKRPGSPPRRPRHQAAATNARARNRRPALQGRALAAPLGQSRRPPRSHLQCRSWPMARRRPLAKRQARGQRSTATPHTAPPGHTTGTTARSSGCAPPATTCAASPPCRPSTSRRSDRSPHSRIAAAPIASEAAALLEAVLLRAARAGVAQPAALGVPEAAAVAEAAVPGRGQRHGRGGLEAPLADALRLGARDLRPPPWPSSDRGRRSSWRSASRSPGCAGTG